jgi:nucleoid-associated protein YgaU
MKQLNRTIRSMMIGAIAFGGAAGVVGCSSTPPGKTASGGFRSDVTDIHPVEPAAYQPPLYDTSAVIPVAPQSITPEPAPVSYALQTAPVTPIMSTTPALAGNTHIVRHGETLFSIARNAYGTGKAWKKIAAANPGVSASKLRVGQKIVLP